jgi:cellulose synthase/poly-beta-1,6-N-acetylglucosamine synthase-like glycosyltransferase
MRPSRMGAVVTASLVATFSARRALLLAAALAPPRSMQTVPGTPPSVALVIPVHDEAHQLEDLLAAIDRIDYPAERLALVLVDDCSSDGSTELMRGWTERRPSTQLVTLSRAQGKASALMAGLAAVPGVELVAFCDADVRPRTGSLRELTAAFGDQSIAAASSLLWPSNADASTVSRYAALESWVHQLVTSRGKDRLDLNPPVLGGMCVYRVTTLKSVGGFRPASWGEDVEATVALTRDGWRTRVVTDAGADYRVAASRAEYWRQHLRWGRAQMESAAPLRAHTGAAPTRPAAALLWARRVEAVLTSAGYLDRLAFAAAVTLAGCGGLSPWWAAGYAAAAAAEVAAAVAMAGAVRDLPSYAKALLMLFPLDIAGTAVGTVQQVFRDPSVGWRTGSQRAVRS